MPDRRHRWRGIHDLEMVRSGLTISARSGASRYRPGDVALVTLRVTSTRIGHAFPTYVTPRVVLSAELVDDAGRIVPGSRQEQVIGLTVVGILTGLIAEGISGPRAPKWERLTPPYRPRPAASVEVGRVEGGSGVACRATFAF